MERSLRPRRRLFPEIRLAGERPLQLLSQRSRGRREGESQSDVGVAGVGARQGQGLVDGEIGRRKRGSSDHRQCARACIDEFTNSVACSFILPGIKGIRGVAEEFRDIADQVVKCPAAGRIYFSEKERPIDIGA